MCARAAEIILKPGVQTVHTGSGWALRGRGITLDAKDDAQNAIIQRIAQGHFGLDDLERVVRESNKENLRDDEASLALADFILDFGDLLENAISE